MKTKQILALLTLFFGLIRIIQNTISIMSNMDFMLDNELYKDILISVVMQMLFIATLIIFIVIIIDKLSKNILFIFLISIGILGVLINIILGTYIFIDFIALDVDFFGGSDPFVRLVISNLLVFVFSAIIYLFYGITGLLVKMNFKYAKYILFAIPLITLFQVLTSQIINPFSDPLNGNKFISFIYIILLSFTYYFTIRDITLNES